MIYDLPSLPFSGSGEYNFSWASVLVFVKDQMENGKLLSSSSSPALQSNSLLPKVRISGKGKYRQWLGTLSPKGPLVIIIRIIVIVYKVLKVCQALV